MNFHNQSQGEESGIPENITLKALFSTDDWKEYFRRIAETVDYELAVVDEEGSQIMVVNENELCRFIRSEKLEGLECPDECIKTIASGGIPAVFKCRAYQTCFSIEIEHLGERLHIIGRDGFASYDDMLEFIRIARELRLTRIPVDMPLNFPGETQTRTIAEYINLSVRRQLDSLIEKNRIEERLVRMTSLFDRQTFGTLSNNPKLLYRYILDTVEFVFPGISAAIMLYDEEESTYRSVCGVGRVQKDVSDIVIGLENTAVRELKNTKVAVFFEDVGKIFHDSKQRNISSAIFFPIFVTRVLKGFIVVFNRRFSYQEMKVMNAFMDYVQLNLENHDLRVASRKHRGADEKIKYLSDFSSALAPVLDRNTLFRTLLDKSLKLLNAEQGSLMLLDKDRSELVVEAHKSKSNVVRDKMRLKIGTGIAGKVIESGGSMLVEDIEKDPRIRQDNRPHYKGKSFISALIRVEDRISGVINIADKVKGEPFNDADLNLLRVLIDSSVIAIERSILYDKSEELRKLSITDPLTGIFNRRYLNRRLSEEITRYNRYKHPFSFIMTDVDKFKQYNDTFGHIAGDNLIKTLAQVMEKSLRAIDIAARFGGDEFVAIFPQTPKDDAIQISNRLKERIDEAFAKLNVEMMLSISMGLATFPDDASSIMELIEKTDQALYLAKKGGGNRVVYL